LSNARFVDEKHNIRPGPPPGDDMTKKANRLCKDFFRDFHGVMNPELVTNVEINNGNQGSVYRCACDDCTDVNPNVVAQKLFKDRMLNQFNMTDMGLIRTEVSAGGVGAELFWFHEEGYFEEFLGHKSDLKDHPTGITMADKNIWSAHAAEIGKLHAIPVDNIDKERYTTYKFAESTGPGGANTRQIIHHFDSIEKKTCGEGDKMMNFLTQMGWTHSEYENNIFWLENLVRGHFKDEEVAILSHNDAHASNVMMDKDDTTGETLILIDFDLTAYGYRGYDAAFIMKQISGQAVRDGLTNEFMSDEDINEWLRIYKENLNDDTVTHEELLFEVNLMLPSVCLKNVMNSSCGNRGNISNSKYVVCKYEELQRMHGYPNPINCESFPNKRPNQCDECEAILIDCIRNCDVDDAQCASTCNREFAYCESNCE